MPESMCVFTSQRRKLDYKSGFGFPNPSVGPISVLFEHPKKLQLYAGDANCQPSDNASDAALDLGSSDWHYLRLAF